MKICYECKLNKGLSEFHKDRTKNDGYYSLCKSCRRKRMGSTEFVRAEIIGYYKGKTVLLGSPYPYIKGTRIRAHRYIMEDVLGRKLSAGEHVHHIDGNKLNFNSGNLVVLFKADHHRLHPTPKGDGKSAHCVGCGKEKWFNSYELKHSYGSRPERIDLYRCKNCGGGGRKKD